MRGIHIRPATALASVSTPQALPVQWGCPADQVEIIDIGARLHDIGKIGIPDAALQKLGRAYGRRNAPQEGYEYTAGSNQHEHALKATSEFTHSSVDRLETEQLVVLTQIGSFQVERQKGFSARQYFALIPFHTATHKKGRCALLTTLQASLTPPHIPIR